MDILAPTGPVYQAGTLSGNPLAVTAGLTTLRILRETNPYPQLERSTAELVEGLSNAARAAGIETTSNRVGSMFTLFFGAGPVVDWTSANTSDRAQYASFFHAMLAEGVYFAPSQFEAGFVSTAHSDEIITRTVEAAERAFSSV